MKSNVSDILDVMACIYQDATMRCSADVSDLRDLMTIRSRVENEGISFLTISLVTYCKAFERSLEIGYVDPTSFAGFRLVKDGVIPAFLQGILGLIFDRETGRLLNENPPDGVLADISDLVACVRQICLAFKKVEIPCTPEREYAAVKNFIEVEQQLSQFSLQEQELREFRHVAFMLWSGMLRGFDHNTLQPRHGPGATAERVTGNSKYAWRYWTERLEPFFPLIGTAFPIGIVDSLKEIENVNVLSPEQELPVRVVLVPKTLKAPRVIAIEPACMQYTQQAVQDFLRRKLETWKYSAGSVNFTDQSINQRLALIASYTGQFSTIDLSDASDRVPLSLVKEMFWYNQDFLDCILACRSNSALLPSGEIISPLAKFASMGSALCFPIEAMYFHTLCVMAALEAYNLPATSRNLLKVTRELYVYGDDIIVPSTYADNVLAKLQLYNCKPNADKTFLHGLFRESCGVDAYGGYEVTPTYFTHLLPENNRQTDALVSAVSTSNAFYKKGFWRTATFIRNRIDGILGPLPYVSETSSGLGYSSFLGMRSIGRWNVDLQRFEVRTFVVKELDRTDPISDYPALAKSLLRVGSSWFNPVESSLDVTVRRGSVTLKRRWVPA